jgi:type III pantothenate kinase
MLLAIDVGNTNTVFALCEGAEIRARWRISTDWQRTADEYAVWLHQLMQMSAVPATGIEAVIIACVVPQMLFNLRGLSRHYFGIEAMVVGAPGVDSGIAVTLPNPAEVGADRVVNAVAAHAQWPGDLIIVDFGTATTFDVVGPGGTFDGGLICPGINLSMDALYRAAARLPRVAVEPPAAGLGIIGTGTVHAMQSGVFWGYVSMIEGLVQRIGAELGRRATVIATGGLAPLFGRQTMAIHHVDGDLTIRGLALIYRRNTEGKA